MVSVKPFCLALLLVYGSEFLMLRADTPPAADTAPAQDDRATALWVLKKGGRIRLTGDRKYISDPFDLPEGLIRIAGVDMHGSIADPKDLEPLRKLKELRDLNCPAASGVRLRRQIILLRRDVRLLRGFQNAAEIRSRPHAFGLPASGRRRNEAPRAADAAYFSARLSLVTIKDPATLAPFVNMENLDLNDAYVTDDIMPGLAGMKKLRRLTMVGTLITDDGVRYLENLTALEELDLWGVRITRQRSAVVSQIDRAPPAQPAGRANNRRERGRAGRPSGNSRSQSVP